MFHDVTLYNLVDIYLYVKISYRLCCEDEGREHFRNFRKFLQVIGRDTPEDSALYCQHLDVTNQELLPLTLHARSGAERFHTGLSH